jgi:guanidinopropionase
MSQDLTADTVSLGKQALERYTGMSTFMRMPFKPDLADVEIALVGLPFEFQSGRGSAKLGPTQIREMSGLIRQYSFHGIGPSELCNIADAGNSPVHPMDPKKGMEMAAEFIASIAERGIAVVSAGGDHGVTYAAIKGIVRDRSPIGLIHLDAHPDAYDDIYGGDYIHHGNAVRAAIEHGYVDAERTISLGIHGTRFLRSDRSWHAEHGMTLLTVEDIDRIGIEETLAEVRRVVGQGPVYVTFDIDVLDTPFAIGTGAPEPGGLSMKQALALVRGFQGLDVIGGDVMEVSPPFDASGQTALNGANIMFEILCATALAYANKRDAK